MGAFGVLIGVLHYAGLYIQLNAALNVGHDEVDNHISGNGKLFKLSCSLVLVYLDKKDFIIVVFTLKDEGVDAVHCS